MIHVIKFNGGLGNQMFQYAFYLSLKKIHPLSQWMFDVQDSEKCHNGFELDKIFNVHIYLQRKIYNFLNSRCHSIFNYFQQKKQEESLKFYEEFQRYNMLPSVFIGFWQTEKYFIGVVDEVRKHFAFKKDKLSQKTLECSQKIVDGNSVSVHIRRGDYLNETFRLVCDDEYYIQAINIMISKVENPSFYVFSDDMDYVKKHFSLTNCIFVDWNKGKDNWQDMYLMSQCKHNIVANSSFSWWGAWLNSNPNKVVVAPRIWFHGDYNKDVVPKEWMRI